MKRFEFPIYDVMVNNFFAPIRDKKDVIRFLVNALKYIISLPTSDSSVDSYGKLILYVDKMSRLFCCGETKIFSIHFPFTVMSSEEGLNIIHKDTEITLDSETTSFLLSVLDRTYQNSIETLDDFYTIFFEELEAFEIDLSESYNYWAIIKNLWTFESGYLRYDVDIEHENGHMHPLNHLDICYSTGSSFKLGLRTAIDTDYFIDILDTTTNCKYVANA